MNEFQEELNVSSEDKIIIDKTRLLLALKKPHSVESVKNILRETEFVLEVEEGIPSDNEIRSMKIINHTDKLFWIRSSVGTLINQENLYRLKEVFGEEFDWIGPVYQPLSRRNDRDQLFCPFPNVLVIKLTPGFNDQDDEFLQRLARYNMKEISEKSKYLSGYRYYTIDDIENQNAYQIKDIFLHETQSVQEVLFENMPMIVHADMRPNDPLFPSQWNMNRIQASGAGATAWNFSTGNSSMAICILDSGCDLTHPDLQFSTPGINLGTMSPDGSPITPPPSSNTGSGHGTACAGIAAGTFNNSQGVAGVAGSCSIMPIAFQNWTDVEIALGINYASAFGAKVISMSWFMNLFGAHYALMNAAIQSAFNNDVVMCAAGNNNSYGIDYPAKILA